MWVAGKNVIPLARAIPKRIRGGYYDALYKSAVTLFHFTCGGIHLGLRTAGLTCFVIIIIVIILI